MPDLHPPAPPSVAVGDLVGEEVSWEEYFPNTVCHFAGTVRSVIVDDDGTVALMVEVVDSVGTRKLRMTSADAVKIAIRPKLDVTVDKIADLIGRMGVVVTEEMCRGIAEILEQGRGRGPREVR